ncbi:MAG: FkbM family methyltransferase [Actinobacteria bacterium]|nr:FkbM family methyltransferase [Actinomycetota bacterium]
MLGDRPLSLILAEVREPGNYRALWRMLRLYPRWRDNFGRYFFARGRYPYRCEIRTPVGIVAPTLWSSHDILTVNEVFCREDYRVGPEVRVVVDIGSNIGISALYFLTRNSSSRVWCYEPVPTNVGRLRMNLADMPSTRFSVREVDLEGTVAFGVEPTGRYGGIGVETGETIVVSCVSINEVLEEVLGDEPTIDLLKIDTEGSEVATVAAIRPELLRRIRVIALETPHPVALHTELFDSSFASQTQTLTNRGNGRPDWSNDT